MKLKKYNYTLLLKLNINVRSCCLQVFYRKAVLQNFSKFSGKRNHCYGNMLSFSDKV